MEEIDSLKEKMDALEAEIKELKEEARDDVLYIGIGIVVGFIILHLI